MRIIIFLLFTTLMSIQLGYSQTLRDFKKKTEENTKERTAMLDLLRADIKNNLEQDVIFVVNHFKVYGNYSWMEGSVQRKDGKELKFPNDSYDCCHVEALFKKVNGSWVMKANGTFSTDIWYLCILQQYPEASRLIFSSNVLTFNSNCN
jgi:hypothetical protein